MKRLLGLILFAAAAAHGQGLNYTPTIVASYLTSDGITYAPWAAGSAFGGLNFVPQTKVAMYCQLTPGAKWTPCNPGNASLNSPAFTGTPTAPTAAPGTNSTQIATTAFVAALQNTSTATIVGNAGNLGTGGTATCAAGYTCTAQRGHVVFATGSGSFSGVQGTLTFATAYGAAPTCLVVQNGANSNSPFWTTTTTTLVIGVNTGFSGTTRELDYICLP
jgi:hypothetical protein